MLKDFFTATAVVALLVGCNQKKEQTQHSNSDTNHQENITNYEGVYKGTLPCADCPGIETSLTLGRNYSAQYITQYLDSEQGYDIAKGSYDIEGDLLCVKLPTDTLYFSIDKEKISLLNKDKQAVTGDLAPYYDLYKMKSNFDFSGTYYSGSSDEKNAYWQKLTISQNNNEYQIDVTASKVKDKENCQFTHQGFIKNDTLFATLKGKDKDVEMIITPTHDQLGVEVFTKDFEDRHHLMYYCGGGGSLAGEYIKNEITATLIGVFSNENTIADVLQSVPYAQIEKQKGEGEFADDVYDDYVVSTRDSKPLFVVTPKNTGDTQQKINRVKVLSPIFRTDKGINIHSTYGDIKKSYTISKIEPTEDHIVVIVDELNADFSISKKHLPKDWWNEKTKSVNADKIPNNAPIDSFVLWWNQ